MKRFSILLLTAALCAFVAGGYYDSTVTKKASTEQVSAPKDYSSVATSLECDVPTLFVFLLPTLGTLKPQLIPYVEKLAVGYVAVNKGPPDYRCQKS